jgi:hypothetical protein
MLPVLRFISTQSENHFFVDNPIETGLRAIIVSTNISRGNRQWEKNERTYLQ